jgi:hypothetical protein
MTRCTADPVRSFRGRDLRRRSIHPRSRATIGTGTDRTEPANGRADDGAGDADGPLKAPLNAVEGEEWPLAVPGDMNGQNTL